MLILGRRAGEAIVVNGDVRVVILACDRRGVRIGIEAPAQVSIVREEILQQVAAENRRAHASPEARALAELPRAEAQTPRGLPAVPAVPLPPVSEEAGRSAADTSQR